MNKWKVAFEKTIDDIQELIDYAKKQERIEASLGNWGDAQEWHDAGYYYEQCMFQVTRRRVEVMESHHAEPETPRRDG